MLNIRGGRSRDGKNTESSLTKYGEGKVKCKIVVMAMVTTMLHRMITNH